jgi:ubiquitin-conjugating enzyme E2 G1|tara:strand:- start:92 stop:571 length:480 start_codon:yes stop_codon:yes gene_type:complete
MAIRRLQSEIMQLNKEPNYFFSVSPNESNFLLWNFILIGPPETFFEGGIFKGTIEFPKEYPNKPPKLIFTSNMYHPNIYSNGSVCISILHEGVDQYGYESVNERWNPSQSVSTVLMSILSMLGYPNFDSPANVDASKEWKDSVDTYKKKIYELVAESQN